MCGICGCSDGNKKQVHAPHTHSKASIAHSHEHANLISIEQDILAKNDQFAAANRQYFSANKCLALNIMSSPGAGKTTLLSKTLSDLKHQAEMAVIVGDQHTDYDAECMKLSGLPAIQVNTGKVCHLDAHSVGHAVEKLSFSPPSILFIENVGNLVCPALFDLGEAYKIVILSVTEGDNKPLKYADMFHAADLLLITKIDLLPYVDFNIDNCMTYARRINPQVTLLTLSATMGIGLNEWYSWLTEKQL